MDSATKREGFHHGIGSFVPEGSNRIRLKQFRLPMAIMASEILSKFPFAETRKYLLPIPEGSKEQRALLLANVELSDGNIFTFICTHLDYPSSEVRQVQVAALTEILKGNPLPDDPGRRFQRQSGCNRNHIPDGNWLQVSTSDFTFPASGPQKPRSTTFFAI
jgi:endonuclease/exonuclease/phosphatase family metal-dependent hydrolase